MASRPAGVPDTTVSIGRALVVYLLVFQHIPEERCRKLLADVTGVEVSDGFIHSCLRKAAAALTGVITLIKTLITAAAVARFDEITLRGREGDQKFVQGAFTEQHTLLFLGVRQDARVDGDYRLTESGVDGGPGYLGTRADDCTVPSAV